MVCKKTYSNKMSLKLKFVFGILVLAVVIGFSTVAFTASTDDSDSQKTTGISFFDPFELTTVFLNVPENEITATVSSGLGATSQVSGSTNLQSTTIASSSITRPPVRIPYRPPLRSPFRPPWVPGSPSWYPGDPPWNP